MSSSYRITTPVVDFTGTVGEYAFAKGAYEGEVTDAALSYFRTAGYGVEDVKAKRSDGGSGGLPAKTAKRPDWEQAARDLRISDEDITAASNKDQLIDLVTTAHDKAAADASADDTQNGATQ